MPNEYPAIFSSLEGTITFNVGSLSTQHTTSFDKLTTFILEGVVCGVMVALMELCGLKSTFVCSRTQKQ